MSQNVPWVILKFGGTSVSTRENWDNIAHVIEKRKEQGFAVIVVHSALKGISNQLQQLTTAISETQMQLILQTIKKEHIDLAEELGLNGYELLSGYFKEMETLANAIGSRGKADSRMEARLMALGELMATTLGCAFLDEQNLEPHWQDARHLLESVPQKNVSEKSAILAAVCDIENDRALQQKLSGKRLVVTQGFIACNNRQETVLLGRGGSDVSAAYLAAKLGAERLEIWTDVPGLFSANPNQIPSARLLKQLSYEEAQEIATNGAHILHPRCIYPACKHNIPIYVRCTHRPELKGTVISNTAAGDEGLVKTIALRANIILISMESLGMWQQVGFLADTFEVFKQFGLSIDLISTSESNVTVSLDPSLNTHFNQIRADFTETLSQYCKVKVIDSVSAVSLLGRHIRTILHRLGESFEVFKEHQIYLLSQAANDLNFTFVVASDQAARLVRQLHEQVISKSENIPALGKTWSELMQAETKAGKALTCWWEHKQEELIAIAHKKGSAYVYDKQELQENIKRIQQIEAVDHFFYAMKANANTQVLEKFYEAGLGFECVSIGEVKRVIKLFPEIDQKRILFTPNFAHRSEYEKGLEYNVNVTLDNIFPLQQWPEIFENKNIFLRIDPGHGQGHHKHVKTGGIHSKFGIPQFEIEEVKRLIKNIGASVTGLHAHTGSGIKDEGLWKKTALILHNVAEKLGGVKILDVGGGFGIQENETQSRLNLEGVNDSLKEFKTAHPQYELWIEPGRFLTATAGVLLTKVTQLKGKGAVKYVGVETGMNSFIRPALYGASHTIVNLNRLDQPASQTVNIVGPICESADKLGIDRRFPESEEGDIILVANTGAYGQVMSSNYNLRPPAVEVFLNS